MVEIKLDEGTDWGKARIALSVGIALQPYVHKAVLQELQFLRKKIVEEFDAEGPPGQKWAPLSPITLAIRKFEGFEGTKILQVTRDLLGSISVIAMEGEGGFIGVARNKTRKDGKDPVNIAQAHEEGFTVRHTMSDRQRRFLFAALAAAGLRDDKVAGRGGAGGSMSVTIRIPARPFLGPIFDTYGKPEDVAASVAARIARMTGGVLGDPGGTPRT